MTTTSSSAVTRRLTDWFDDLNLAIKTIDERPDQPGGEVAYVIKDVFTTNDGSWEVNDQPYAVPEWAKETYLDPGQFAKAHERNNLYAAVIGLDGTIMSGEEILFWTGGLGKLIDLASTTNAHINASEAPGWATMVMYNSSAYDPASGQSGPWCWTPAGLPAEVICGGGLPNGNKVSTFVVWQAVPAGDQPPTPRPPDPTPKPPDPTPQPPPTTPVVQRRLGTWVDTLNLQINPVADRPDKPAVGDVVYLVKDVFTTRDGSWEPSSVYGSVDQWARDAYLKPLGAPDFFDDAGGDHHLFAAVIGLDGELLRDFEIKYWSDGLDMLADPNYNSYTFRTTKTRSGWANIVMSPSSSYVPERGEAGPWCWVPSSGAADVVCGGGMPAKQHVSVFVVWQAVPREQIPDSGDGTVVLPPPVTTDFKIFMPTISSGGVTRSSAPAQSALPPALTAAVSSEQALLDHIRASAWNRLGIEYRQGSTLADHARQAGLGMPTTNLFEAAGYLVQGFQGGIVLAPLDSPTDVTHLPW